MEGVAAEVDLLVCPNGHKDVTDHLRAGGHLDELVAPCAQEVQADGPPLGLAEILDTTEAFFRRYVALSEAQYVAVVLWVAHAHALDATATTRICT